MRLPLTARYTLVVACAFLAAIAPAAARGQAGSGNAEIPAAYMPPPGLCRIWVEKVPPEKQPAPTDCTKALRNKPSNARVIFGDAKATAVTPPRTNAAPPPATGGRGNVRPDSTKAQRDSAKAKRDTVASKRDTISTPTRRSHSQN